MNTIHSVQIPVLGTGFTIDSPIKVAKYGISSVISLVDDTLIETMRKYYCNKFGENYTEITKQENDYRAKRITAYLNLLDKIIKQQFEDLKSSAFEIGTEITKYFELLPENSQIKKLYITMLATTDPDKKQEMQKQLRNSMQIGEINVNIMTKIDKINSSPSGEDLPTEYSDALAALRGYAQSTLKSAIVFSAGFNQRLYSYVKEFKDFYADAKGSIKKKIILKVSDYRSSIIQGKFFAKKGIWISEFRIESGLNCGGHAFATSGQLMGPILEEFKNKKQELINKLHDTFNNALKLNNKSTYKSPLATKITAQGGIGTASEDQFIRSYYDIDYTGWGTPFLLCPDATSVDDKTLKQLSEAQEEDLYMSDVSPLNVIFNNMKSSSSDLAQQERVKQGKPGSHCPKQHLHFNTEFTKKPICTASRQYQKLKIEQLEKMNLPEEEYKASFNNIVAKACICHDLGEGVLLKNNIADNNKPHFPAVCPGPNLAYFSKVVSLREMMGHIYGKLNILSSKYRPNMFIKELDLYITYLLKEIKKCTSPLSEKQKKYFNNFRSNLLTSIDYYYKLFPKMIAETNEYRQKALEELDSLKNNLINFTNEIL